MKPTQPTKPPFTLLFALCADRPKGKPANGQTKKVRSTSISSLYLAVISFCLSLVVYLGGCAGPAARPPASHVDPQALEASGTMEMASLEKMAYEAMQRGDVAAGIRLYEEILEKDPTNARVIYYLGYAFGQAGDHEQEISYYRKAVAQNYRTALIYYNLGEAYLGDDQVEDAVQAFKEGLQIDADSADNHFGLGRAYHLRGQNAAAEEELLEAVRLSPQDIVFKEYLGFFYEQIGQPRNALNQYQSILEIAPDAEDVRDRLEAINKVLEAPENPSGGMGGQ